ncbi:MAG: hypothetical protein ACTHNN_08990 [Xanthobacteraceae bacterium]
MAGARGLVEPQTFVFDDDGLVPNNRLPVLRYRLAVDVTGKEPERIFENLFAANGWGGLWRNGIFDYLHYHATVHEALGIARGHAKVRLGGDRGATLELVAGDAVILPAGTGHQCLSASGDFSVVGAYPPGEKMQITKPTPDNYRKALKAIPNVPQPVTDPVQGVQGALMRLWKTAN